MEPASESESQFGVVTFDLATGAKVRVRAGEFLEELSRKDQEQGLTPGRYFGIRVYCDEDTNPKRLIRHTEFRAGIDFEQHCLRRLWAWLGDLSVSRHRFSYDNVEEFLNEFSDSMNEFGAISEDAADRL